MGNRLWRAVRAGFWSLPISTISSRSTTIMAMRRATA
jgi:hypothetical protein